jgi:hypothetical protein
MELTPDVRGICETPLPDMPFTPQNPEDPIVSVMNFY